VGLSSVEIGIIPCYNTIMINEQFGRKLQMLRQDHHLEPLQVAQQLGITAGSYLAMEQGKSTIRLDMLYRLAKAFNVSVAELMKGVEEL